MTLIVAILTSTEMKMRIIVFWVMVARNFMGSYQISEERIDSENGVITLLRNVGNYIQLRATFSIFPLLHSS
jgi:hypothetical protein